MKEFLRAIVWFVVTAAIAKKICGADLATTQLLTAEGTVEIMRAQSSQWNPAKSGEALQINDRLRTGKKSRAIESAVLPAFPVKVICGRRFAIATPICALAACRLASATRISGR